MSSVPLVSIVIPASNPDFFAMALQDALAQTYPHLEVIVCDDSRGAHIQAACEAQGLNSQVPIRYLRNAQSLGLVGNLQRGLDEARGELVKFLCDDDRLYTECVPRQAAAMLENPDVNLVLAQRYFCDRDEIRLPARMANVGIAPTTSLFLGTDMLGMLESYPSNFLGCLSSALFRRGDLQVLLPALTTPGHCFEGLLDLALFICLLGRGNMVYVNDILVVERLHPQRLSRRQSVLDGIERERDWLSQMLKERGSELPPHSGYVRYVPLEQAGQVPRQWEELGLNHAMIRKVGQYAFHVGLKSESFAELYQDWLGSRVMNPAHLALLPDVVASWPQRPRIVPVIVDPLGHAAGVEMSLRSLAEQHYPPELILVLSADCAAPQLEEKVFTLPLQDDVNAQINQLLPQLDGADWIYLLRSGDRLTAPALFLLAQRISQSAALQCLYSDEGALRDGESLDPVFKPDFNLDMLRSYPYVGRNLAFQRQAVLACGGLQSRFGELASIDLMWQVFESSGSLAIGHVAEVLVESQYSLAQWLAVPQVVEQSAPVVEAHLQRLGIDYRLKSGPGVLLTHIEYLHPTRPLVSIVIVSKDQLALVQRCVECLLGNTGYGHFEVVLVNNASVSADARAWFAGMGRLGGDKLRVLECESTLTPAAAFNAGAAQARGEWVLFFSPYLVATQQDWLEQMVQLAQRPEVAVVGPRLVRPDGSVEQAGLVLGMKGGWATPFYSVAADAPGYMQRLQITQNYSAVGIDCLMVSKSIFDALDGFNTTHFASLGLEVDLCLRIAEHGLLTVWTPFAQLAIGARTAHEHTPELQHLAGTHMLDRWLPRIARDPAYNPNLSLDGASFVLEPGKRNDWYPFTHRPLPTVMGLPINTSAVGHYRVVQPLKELEAAGRVVGRVAYETPTLVDIERSRPDVVILQGRYFDNAIEEAANLKRYFNSRLIFELDDLVTNVPKKNDHARDLPPSVADSVKKVIARCDRVVVSTEPLADALAGMHQDIRVVPNMLATELWSNLHSKRRTSRKPRVGWGGGTSHRGDLELIADVVRLLADEVEWVFFGMCPDILRPYVHEFHGVIGLAVYPAKLASLNLDLALAPLEFHPFNDCKSNLRLLEYGACGYPVICSNTAAYGGYLPCTRVLTNSTAEWLEAIRMHLADPEASYRMGDELKRTVMRDYMLRADNVQHWASAWLGD